MAITTDQANYATYFCSGLACLLLLCRIYLNKNQPRFFDVNFFVALIGFVSILLRAIGTEEVLRLGTASDAITKLKKTPTLTFTPDQLANIKTGSILSVFNRVVTTSALWSMNLLLLLLYRRFVQHLPWMKHVITATLAFMGVSFIIVTLASFLECRPFHLYWQIKPAPGICVKAYTQTLLQGICNILTDCIIMGISVPIVFIQGSKTSLRIRIACLISLGAFCVIASILRLVYIFQNGSLQATRTFWASINIGVAAFVANAPVLYGSINIHKRKKQSSAGYTYGPQSGANGRATAPSTNLMASRHDVEKGEAIVKHTVVTVETTHNDGRQFSAHSSPHAF